MRLGRLQRQSRRAFWASAWASAAPEVSTSELAGVLGETDANRKARTLTLATEFMIRAGPQRLTGRRPRLPRKGGHPIAG